MTCQVQSYPVCLVADSLEGDSRGLSPSSITVICIETGELGLICVHAVGAQKSDVGSHGCGEGSVQFQRVSRGDPGSGGGMCAQSLRTGGLKVLEEEIAWTLVAMGRACWGKLGRLGRACAIWCSVSIRLADSEL